MDVSLRPWSCGLLSRKARRKTQTAFELTEVHDLRPKKNSPYTKQKKEDIKKFCASLDFDFEVAKLSWLVHFENIFASTVNDSKKIGLSTGKPGDFLGGPQSGFLFRRHFWWSFLTHSPSFAFQSSRTILTELCRSNIVLPSYLGI